MGGLPGSPLGRLFVLGGIHCGPSKEGVHKAPSNRYLHPCALATYMDRGRPVPTSRSRDCAYMIRLTGAISSKSAHCSGNRALRVHCEQAVANSLSPNMHAYSLRPSAFFHGMTCLVGMKQCIGRDGVIQSVA
jgi:hypothetical protein